nr:hypothetical protein [Candidatus Sigynarchaeota archaeon]
MKTKGTKEWADTNVNCVDGCAHDCRYCYAKKQAIRFKRTTEQDWHIMAVRPDDVAKGYRKRDGRIMFPTSHDLIPADPSFASCMVVLEKLLRAGNEVLVTTKPHLDAVRYICNNLERYRSQIQFRFTITSMDDAVLKYWEPNAPSFQERFRSIEYAWHSEFKTSVSIEPILDSSLQDLEALYDTVEIYTTESIWLGTMNHVKGSVMRQNGVKLDPASIYRHFVNKDGLVRFKDSIRNAVGIA